VAEGEDAEGCLDNVLIDNDNDDVQVVPDEDDDGDDLADGIGLTEELDSAANVRFNCYRTAAGFLLVY